MAVHSFNPNNLKSRQRLREAMRYSRRQLQAHREKNLAAITQYVGHNYGRHPTDHEVPVNLIELAVQIYVQQLISQLPKAMVSTKFKELKAFAATYELAINHLSQEIRLGETLSRLALNALFSVGIAKIGMGLSGDVEIDGFRHDVGQPFCDVVELDDWVHDMRVNEYERISFAGNYYTLPLEWVKQSGHYRNASDLKPTNRSQQGEDQEGEDRVESLGREESGEDYGIHDEIGLCDIWLPFENIIVTLPSRDQGDAKPLREVQWDGPENGPYRLLSFYKVPGNTMPLPPVAGLMDMHGLVNSLYNKLNNQATRQKTVGIYRGSAADDGSRLVESSDGDMIRNDDPGGVSAVTFGGIHQPTLAMAVHAVDRFVWLAGNLNVLGGLSPQTETVGQDQLLAANASKRMQAMQAQVMTFTRDIMQDLGFWLWVDPLINLPLVKRIEGTDIEVAATFSPEEREGDYLQYNFELQPHSAQFQSPSQKLQTLTGIFQNFIVPFAPMLEQQGATIDFQELLRLVGKLANSESELADIIQFSTPSLAEQMGPVGAPPRQAPVTRRISERVNRPGATQPGKDNALMQTLLGGAVQPSEAAAADRPVG